MVTVFGRMRQVGSAGIPQSARKRVQRMASPLDLFQQALRAYGDPSQTSRQAWLIEAVLRTSRGVADVTVPLEPRDLEILVMIRRKYQPFAKGLKLPRLERYTDAYFMLRRLFF